MSDVFNIDLRDKTYKTLKPDEDISLLLPAEYDVIIIDNNLHKFANYKRVLHEAFRLLKLKGHLYVITEFGKLFKDIKDLKRHMYSLKLFKLVKISQKNNFALVIGIKKQSMEIDSDAEWKTDKKLYDCKRIDNKKDIEYSNYSKEFIFSDPLQDWKSFYDSIITFWNQIIKIIGIVPSEWDVLDCGTRDGLFPMFLKNKVKTVVGIDIDERYIQYAQSLNRPVIYGDINNIPFPEKSFDLVFSHHVLGLAKDYFGALDEMVRVCKVGGYIATANNIPGNKLKHYYYIGSVKEFHNWAKLSKVEIVKEWNIGKTYFFIFRRIS